MICIKTLTYDALEAQRGRVVQSYQIHEVLSPTPAMWRGQPIVIVATDWREDGFAQLFVTESGLKFLVGEATGWIT